MTQGRQHSEWRDALAAIEAGRRAADLESETLDFKEEAGSEKETCRDVTEAALCFANARGGLVVIGVRDAASGTAAFVGATIDSVILKRRIYELSRPHLVVDAEAVSHRGKTLVIVRVPSSPEIHADTKGRAPRRIGTDCLPMDPSEQMRLREERLGIDWSARPGRRTPRQVSRKALAAARDRLAAFVDQRRELADLSDADLLRALGVVSAKGDLLRAGEVLFCAPEDGDAPAIVYLHRITPGGEPRTVERLETPLVLAFGRAMELVQARRNVSTVSLPRGLQIEIEDFPELAVREAMANAVIHRDYHLRGSVQLEHSPEVLAVTSPGPLVSGVTPDNILTHPSKPRNPVLARAARQLGLAEEVGRGVDRMFREMIRSGRDVPHITASHDQVRVALVGGAPKTQVARFVAGLPTEEREDTDTLLVLFRLCSDRHVTAETTSPVLQKTADEVEVVLRRLATDRVGILEPTRETARRARPRYRLRGEVLRALGGAIPYQRRTTDDIDRKIVAHVREYDKVTNRTVQNLLDQSLQGASNVLADLVQRGILRKTSTHERGPGVEYGRGPKFPSAPRRRKDR